MVMRACARARRHYIAKTPHYIFIIIALFSPGTHHAKPTKLKTL